MKRRWIPGVVVAVLVAGGLLYLRNGNGKSPEKSEYTVAEVSRGEILTTITSSGTLEPVSTVDVGTQVSGIINKLYADFNDTVTEGQVIAELDRTFLLGALDEALASRNRAQALFGQAEAEYTRNKPLFEKGFISAQEFTKLETDYKTQKAALQSADASVKKAQINLKFATITSPITGTVIERNIEEGQTVAASFSAPILYVIAENLRRMQILASVDEADIGGIKKGQEVRFSVQAYPDSVFSGAVEQVRLQPTVTQNVVTYTVVIGTENRNGVLLPGMTATVDFIMEKASDVLMVPNAALRFTPEGVDSLSGPLVRKARGRENGNRWNVSGMKTGLGTPDGKRKLSGKKERKNRGVIWQVAEDNILSPIVVRTGLTDGKNTMVESRMPLDEGTRIVTGLTTVSAKKKKSISLLPQPRRGRRH